MNGQWRGSVLMVLASSTGGIGQHVAAVAQGLSQVGVAVTVAGPKAVDQLFQFSQRGVRFEQVEIASKPHPGDARAVRVIQTLLAELAPDLVHAHGLRAGLAVAFARPNCPFVVTWHNAPIASGLRGWMHVLVERLVARAATVTLGASADLVGRAKAAGAADARPASVAAPQQRRSHRHPASIRAGVGVDEDVPVLLSVGRLHPQKNYGMLVAAAARWRDLDPVPRVLIAGEGPSYLELAAKISQLRAPVTLLGHRTDVADLIAVADLAVMTSIWEARQLFAQEALAGGLPLIATDVGGVPELVGDAAVLIEPGDVDALDQAVRRLLADPAERAALAERGRTQAATWPDEQSVVTGLRRLYGELSLAHAGKPS